MCGIAGIIGENELNIDIESILEKIGYRGPDGLFYTRKERLSFGHARLSIIDLNPTANQPMVDESTGNIIIFNGEIYNYPELKKEIGKRYSFKTNSDSEVLLAAYHVFGTECFSHLRGMFAFALYDNKKKKVLLARDRVGIKPLYYRKLGQTVFFASEIKAIINLDGKPESIYNLKVYEFLANRQLDTDEHTFFEGIYQLPPSHYLWIGLNGRIEASKAFWDYPKTGNRRLDKNAEKEFVELFDETISMHLRSDVEIGSFLSGGIDSSSVTRFASRNMRQSHLHTFSAILPYYHAENALIKDVVNVDRKIIDHQFLLDGNTFFEDIENVIFHHDEPILDGSMYAHYKLCALAKENNIKVLLSGSGGDELFGGYSSHLNAYHSTLLSELKIKKYVDEIKLASKSSANPVSRLMMKSVYDTLPFAIKRRIKNVQLQGRSGHLEDHPKIKHFYFEDSNRYYANLMNNYKSWTVPPYLHYEDRNSMAFGIEIRVPFYDHKLIDFVFQFSPGEIVNGGNKSMLRNSFKGIVPDKILTQKGKFGFPSPIDHALATDERGKEMFFELYRTTPFLKPKETEKLGMDFYHGKAELTVFWRVLSYMLWYNIFFNGNNQN